MFKKRKCSKCKKKISKGYRFCPHCGHGDRDFDDEKWGMLGNSDLIPEMNKSNNLLGGVGGGMLGKVFNSAIKMLEKEMQKEMKNTNNLTPRTNMRLMVNGKEVPLNNLNKKEISEKKLKKKIPGQFSQEDAKKFSELSKQEPQTNIRRLADKVIYEIEIPGVKSLKDISIIQLETSIEIKAIAKNQAYFKKIPLNFPIINHNLSNEKLILEFGIKN